MKRIITFVLCVCMIFLASCAGDESQKYIQEQQEAANEVMSEIENNHEDDVFLLRNNTGKDIYSIEFSAEGKESLLIEAVLPAGNEVKIKNSGVWEISCEFLSEDGQYYKESFGSVDLNYNGAESVVILTENENEYAILTE